jgi:hypothetical protein
MRSMFLAKWLDKILLLLAVILFSVAAWSQQNGEDKSSNGTQGNASGRNGGRLDAEGPKSTTPPSAIGNISTPTAGDWGEDLNSLNVPGAPGTRVHVEDAFQIEEASYPKFTRELLRVQWRPVDPLDLVIVKPVGVKNPPVILYLYSFPSDTDRYVSTELCNALTAHGVAAVGFVSALTGHRYHERPTKEWFVSQLQESLATSVHDVQFILDYLSARGDFDMSRVGMWADGSGASIAIMAAAADPRIKALDLLDPWGDWPNWLQSSTIVPDEERADYLKPEFLKQVENLDPVKWLPSLGSRQMRLQFISQVKTTPLPAQNRIQAAAPPSATVKRYDNLKDFLSAEAATRKPFEWIQSQVASEKSVQDSRVAAGGSGMTQIRIGH